MYAVFHTQKFDKELKKKLSFREQEEIQEFELQLTNNPLLGDPLGYSFFREKKIDGKRIYFLIYEQISSILMVRVSDKKNQQEVIDHVKQNLREYYMLMQESIKQRA